jgi:hypothetical protein
MIHDFTGIAREFPAGFHRNFSVQVQRELFLALPPKLQAETLERAMEIVARYPQSWLARHWREIYRER